jgi:hypothetical protein
MNPQTPQTFFGFSNGYTNVHPTIQQAPVHYPPQQHSMMYYAPYPPMVQYAPSYPNMYSNMYMPHQNTSRYRPFKRSSQSYYCKNCERTFEQHSQFMTHVQSHRQCTKCDFKASKQVLEIHMQEVHPRPVMNASLESPEEIAKWIEERKKRYPTDENIKKKQEEAELNKKRKAKTVPTEKKKSCKYFRQGKCRRGDECTFLHQEKSNQQLSKKPTLQKQSLLSQLLKPEMEAETKTLINVIEFIISKDFFSNK